MLGLEKNKLSEIKFAVNFTRLGEVPVDHITRTWARICKRLRRPGIDSEDSIPPAYVAWRAGTTYRVVVPARQAGNRFLGSLKGLQIRTLSESLGGTGPASLFRNRGYAIIFSGRRKRKNDSMETALSLFYRIDGYRIESATLSACCEMLTICTSHTVKKRSPIFPSPGGMSLTNLSLARNSLIIPGQGEFG